MTELEAIENLHLLLSHRHLYGMSRSIDEILDGPVSSDLLCLLSILAFKNSEEKRFRFWALSNLAVFADRRPNTADDMSTRCVFGRIQIFECWKLLLSRAGTLENSTQNRNKLSGKLHELFARINDNEDDGDPHQSLVKGGIHFGREDYLFKLYRSQKIFLDGQRLAPYVAEFERQYGFELDSYLAIIFAIVNRCHSRRQLECFDPHDLDSWCIDLLEMHRDLKIDLELLSLIMNAIAFTLDEGVAFAVNTINETANFELFRNRPFLKLSETCFLPIEGKLVEELLFDNLLHRLHLASGRNIQFFAEFGHDFEQYTQNLIRDFCTFNSPIAYECIPEFTYGKDNKKSPDVMVRCEQDQTLLAFEVKSARYLDSVLTSDNAPDVVADSFDKLRYKPWKQVHDAIERIVGEHRHPRLIEGLRYLFVVVSMNEIPHSLEDYEIRIHGRDVSYCFHSFGIHTLELLLIAASVSSEYTLYDILLNAFAARRRISTRTTVLRIYRAQNRSSSFFARIRDETIHRDQDFFDRYSTNPAVAWTPKKMQ